ncbi:Flp pilus assembly protein CpaB [bacterium]|nr:Flp pilus assembly protein CpaB [bacterium]
MSRVAPGTMTVVVFALLVGLGGAYVVRHELRQEVAAAPALPDSPASTIAVPVALTDLPAGHKISIDDVGIHRLSEADYAKSEYAKQSHLTNSRQIAGRVLRNELKKGSVFSMDDLYHTGDGPGVIEHLEAGYRAVSVPIQNVGAVQGFARPGSFVDVLFRSTSENERPEVTLTLFERVKVLAINTMAAEGAPVSLQGNGSVTLSVTPHQAKVLKVVEGRGEVSLVLRHPDDDFQFLPFDPALERTLSALESVGIDVPGQQSATAGFQHFNSARTAAANAPAPGAAPEAIEGVDRVIGNAAERITMDDLLGMPATPPKRQMEIYRGPSKEIQVFEAPAAESLETLRRGGRISTPIVEYPIRPRTTARID